MWREGRTLSDRRYRLKTAAGLIVGLTVVLITLRISGSIRWPWALLLAPIWIGACALTLMFVAAIRIGKTAEISLDPNRAPPIPTDG
jgi:hypothetical protein